MCWIKICSIDIGCSVITHFGGFLRFAMPDALFSVSLIGSFEATGKPRGSHGEATPCHKRCIRYKHIGQLSSDFAGIGRVVRYTLRGILGQWDTYGIHAGIYVSA